MSFIYSFIHSSRESTRLCIEKRLIPNLLSRNLQNSREGEACTFVTMFQTGSDISVCTDLALSVVQTFKYSDTDQQLLLPRPCKHPSCPSAPGQRPPSCHLSHGPSAKGRKPVPTRISSCTPALIGCCQGSSGCKMFGLSPLDK